MRHAQGKMFGSLENVSRMRVIIRCARRTESTMSIMLPNSDARDVDFYTATLARKAEKWHGEKE